MDTQDDNGYISSYLGRDIRTVIDTENKTYQTNYLIKNGKDVIGKTQNGTSLTDTYNYTPYGKAVSYDNSKAKADNTTLNLSVNPFRYSGYYYDSESGLYYLNARYYSPELMRFISRDTYDLANRYAYANGNPIMNVDPLGHMSKIANFFIQFFAGGASSELGEIVGGGVGQLIVFAIDEAVYAGVDLGADGNMNEFRKDTIFNAIGNSVGFLHFLWRAGRVSSRGNIAFGYIGREYEKNMLKKTFVENEISWQGKKILTEEDVKNIFYHSRVTAKYNNVCNHAAVLWALSEKGISKDVSIDDVANIMRRGFKWNKSRLVCDASFPEITYGRFFKFDKQNITKAMTAETFLENAKDGKYILINRGDLPHSRFVLKQNGRLLESNTYSNDSTELAEFDGSEAYNNKEYLTSALLLN